MRILLTKVQCIRRQYQILMYEYSNTYLMLRCTVQSPTAYRRPSQLACSDGNNAHVYDFGDAHAATSALTETGWAKIYAVHQFAHNIGRATGHYTFWARCGATTQGSTDCWIHCNALCGGIVQNAPTFSTAHVQNSIATSKIFFFAVPFQDGDLWSNTSDSRVLQG